MVPKPARVFHEKCAGWQERKKHPSFPLPVCETIAFQYVR